MQKLIVVIILFAAAMCVSETFVSAQTINGACCELISKGDRIFYGGEKMTKTELRGVLSQESYEQYVKARNLNRFGAAMTGAGGAIFIFSAVSVIGGSMNQSKSSDDGLPNDAPVGIAIFSGAMIVGGAMMAVGIPCICIGCRRVGDIVSEHNTRNVSLTLGPTRYGAGLSLTF